MGLVKIFKKLKTIHLDPVRIDGKLIEREYEAKNLGITFDEELSWIRHVNLLIAKSYGKLKQGFRFKNFLNEGSKFKMTETYILSQFNYGDIILRNLSEQSQKRYRKYKTDVFDLFLAYVNMITLVLL